MTSPDYLLLRSENQDLRARLAELELRLSANPDGCVTNPGGHSEFRSLADNSPDCIDRLDREFRHLYVNAATASMMGCSPADIIGKTIREAGANGAWADDFEQRVRGVFETGQACDFEGTFPTAAGLRSFETRCAPERAADGAVVSVLAVSRDVTRRKEVEEALRESEAVLRSFFDSPGVIRGIIEIANGRIQHVVCNAAAAEIFGVDQAKISGKSAAEAGASEEVTQLWLDLYEKSRNTGQPVSMEYARKDASGQKRWLFATANYVGEGPDGSPRFGYAVLDLTARKRAEAALSDSEERNRFLAEMLERSDQPFATGYQDGSLGIFNPAFEHLTGYGRDELQGMNWSATLTPPEWHAAERAQLAELDRTGKPVRYEKEYLRKDGTRVPIELLVHRSTDPQGRPIYYSFLTDRTEHKRIAEVLREDEQRQCLAAQAAKFGTSSFNFETGEAYWSQGLRSLLGLQADEPVRLGEDLVLIGIHPEDRKALLPRLVAALDPAGDGRVSFDYRSIRPDGSLRWLHVQGFIEFSGEGENRRPHRGYCATVDITERKQSEEALRKSEERFRLAVKATNDAVWDFDVATGTVHRSESYDALCGKRPESANTLQWWIDHLHPEDRDHTVSGFHEAIQGNASTWAAEYRFQRSDGEWAYIYDRAYIARDAFGHAWRVIGAMQDLTERKRAEEHLREAQKLESLGLMAGGVAHDFNNLLVGVIGNASLALDMFPPDHPAAELLKRVLKAGEHAAHLTRQMLAYSGKGKFLVEALNLSELIPDMSGLVRPSISKKIELRLELKGGLPPVEADRGQIQQVLMNLVINAAEAIGNNEGRITVRTAVHDVDEMYRRRHLGADGLPPGKYVGLEVRDTGSGMDEATRAKIFDPFFSTKFTGRGLGLAAVAGIVRGHKGAITVSSTLGIGSCFTVLFPAAERPAEAAHSPAGKCPCDGAGTILVVDDEQIVREMAKTVLERRGYSVLLAESAKAALDSVRRHPGEIALVILDLNMPHMSGEMALPELRKIRPGIKVVVSSGYSEAETMTLFQGQRVSGFIQKPYSSTGLAEKVAVCIK